jgi:hypothetical protein
MDFSSSSEALKAFIAQCEAFKQGKLVMVQQKIRLLLRCIAYYDELKTLVEGCTEDFNFDKEYSKCIINLGTSMAFRLPGAAKKKIAITISLLLDFDEPNRDFVRFIREFFPSYSNEESYQAFCEGVISPFEEAMVSLLSAAYEKTKEADLETDAILEEISIALSEQANSLVENASAVVKAAHLTEGTRNDIILMLDNFLAVLRLRDAQVIKGYWLGLRNTLKTYKLAPKFIINMEELLKDFNAM